MVEPHRVKKAEKPLNGFTTFNWIFCGLVVCVGCFRIIDSFEVCVAPEVVCPAETCCRQDICNATNSRKKCCEGTGRGCSNCPKCIDCQWASWTECMIKCPEGNTNAGPVRGSRHRKFAPARGPGGKDCDGDAREDCEDYCPVHCKLEPETWPDWSEWADHGQPSCQIRTKTRRVLLEPQNNGTTCEVKYQCDDRSDCTEKKETKCFGTCDDKIKNGHEEGIDCGGPECPCCRSCCSPKCHVIVGIVVTIIILCLTAVGLTLGYIVKKKEACTGPKDTSDPPGVPLKGTDAVKNESVGMIPQDNTNILKRKYEVA